MVHKQGVYEFLLALERPLELLNLLTNTWKFAH